MSQNINPEQHDAENEDVDVVAHGQDAEAVSEDICVINNKHDLA
ncbi:hypothetical protein GCM10020229_26190 [Kitasatospora albolonga]